MDASFQIRPASRADLERLLLLERQSFSDPWTPAQMIDTLIQPTTLGLILAPVAGEIIGYLLSRVVADEAEILTLAVRSSERRRGLGRELLQAGLAAMMQRGVRSVWLEVRESNAGARSLYAQAGFVAVGVRRGYYRRPVEDALVLKRELALPAFVEPPLQ